MDPAETAPETTILQKAVISQGVLLGQYKQLLRTLSDNNQTMVNQITELSHQVSLLVS